MNEGGLAVSARNAAAVVWSRPRRFDGAAKPRSATSSAVSNSLCSQVLVNARRHGVGQGQWRDGFRWAEWGTLILASARDSGWIFRYTGG